MRSPCLEGLERAGADVAEHHAKRREHHAGASTTFRDSKGGCHHGGGRRMAYVLVQPNPPTVALSRLLRRGVVRSGHFAQAHRPARGTEKHSRVLELPGFQANAVAPATAGLPRGPGRECW